VKYIFIQHIVTRNLAMADRSCASVVAKRRRCYDK